MRKSAATALATVLSALCILLAVGLSFVSHNSDPNGCEMSWSYPSFAEFSQFHSDNSLLGNRKYNLRIYREGGPFWKPFDPAHDKPKGVPVLFIPGNAGSVNQARSIGSYFAQKSYNSADLPQIDLYAVDLHEDFTAFHGLTLRDQAYYVNDAIQFIQSLYAESPSVVLVGHSMGGMVARTIVTLPTYRNGSVETIITLSTPHVVPALTFDSDVMSLYDEVNRFWRNGFSENGTSTLDNVVLISIAGGHSDRMVPSDYADVASIVPPSHGFSTFTYSIPGVWTSIDHLAMAWCHQLRRAVCDAVYSIVDSPGGLRTLPVHDRINRFRDALLYDRWENVAAKTDREPLSASLRMDMDFPASLTQRPTDGSPFWLEKGSIELSKLANDDEAFVVLHDTLSEVYLCDSNTAQCRNTEEDSKWLPVSNSDSQYAFETKDHPYWQLAIYDAQEILPYDSVLTKASDDSSFVAAGRLDRITVAKAWWWPLLTEITVHVPGAFADIDLQGAVSGLVAYSVELKSDSELKNGSQRIARPFEPIIRHVSDSLLEAKTFVNVNKAVVATFHGAGPFVPSENEGRGLRLQIFSPHPGYTVTIKKDVWASLGNVAMRYRLIPVSWSLGVSLIAVWNQAARYLAGDTVPHYGQAMTLFVHRQLWILVVVGMIVHFALGSSDLATAYLLGTSEPWAAVLIPLFLVVGAAFNYVMYCMAWALRALAAVFVGSRRRLARVAPWSDPALFSLGVVCLICAVAPYQCVHLFVCLWQLSLSASLKDSRAHLLIGFAVVNLWTTVIYAPLWAVWARNFHLWWSQKVVSILDVTHILGLAVATFVVYRRPSTQDGGVFMILVTGIILVLIASWSLLDGPLAISGLPQLTNGVGYALGVATIASRSLY